MKVGTDSVLLGSFARVTHEKRVLDIGTGTGLLALMMAQRTAAHIDAVETDAAAYAEASQNATASPWQERIEVHHRSFQAFASTVTACYDLLISNPPYYPHDKHLGIEDVQRATARHTAELSFDELCSHAAICLCDTGVFWLILPVQESMQFHAAASGNGLHLHEEIRISAKASKAYNRVVLCYGKQQKELVQRSFTIYEEDGRPTMEYVELTRSFLLWKEFPAL